GYRGTGSIGDYVWFDADGNAAQNDGVTAGLAGVDLILSGDFDGDNVDDYTVTTTTAADGSYSFEYLLGGTYTIAVDTSTLPSPAGAPNWVQTYDLDEGIAPPLLDHTATAITLAAGEDRGDVDFGYRGTGSLGDRVWYDLDADGVQDATEFRLAGVEVTITADLDGDNINNYTNSVITDANGNYLFANLPQGEYTISINTATLPDGAVSTYDLDSATTAPDDTTVYSLNRGENTAVVDFGYTGPGSIGDRVWDDSNADGVHDLGENGIGGVVITLTGDLDNDGVADETMTTITAADGTYSFDHLFLGNYEVTVDETTLPPGSHQTHDLDDPAGTDPIITPYQADVLLTDTNPVNNDVDFGYNSQGTIGNTIWYDADGDSLQDADELGLAGVTVVLDGPYGPMITTTDANGHYLFAQLPAGDYTVSVSNLPDGMIQTADPDGGNDNSATLTLALGATNLNQDFGYTGTGSIGDTVWNDADTDGLQDPGEGGFAGVTVTLTADLNNDGTLDTVTTTTDADGNYHFDNLPVDTYVITVDDTTLPPGVIPTYDFDGTGTEHTATVVLAAGETNNDLDFGYQQTGTIGDTIWYDADADGVQDTGELGLAGVTVTLDGPSGPMTVITDENGKYFFEQLVAGDYTISVSNLPGGMEQTYDLDGTTTADSVEVTLGDRELNLDVDFGYTGIGSIGDTVWNDANGDGIEDSGEGGLPGITIILSGDLNNDGTPDSISTITDADGHYTFDHLPEGNYTISVDDTTLPPGTVQTGDPQGPMDNSADVILGSGNSMVIDTIDFGYQQTGTIGDTVWYDMNANGIQDSNEPGLGNVNVTLVGDLDGDGQVDDTRTVVTDGNGNYLFDHLPAGEYTLTVDPATLPQGMVQTYDLDGLATGDTAVVSIGENEANFGVDFGYTGTGTIGDTIWYDANGDGGENPGETGLGGISVTLIGDLDNDGQADDILSVTTAADGSYSFTNLPAGVYTIVVDPATLPGGMIQTGDPDDTGDNTTVLTLGAGELNNEQDFGYSGTGSIGDTVWYDSNRNGIQEDGESGIAGVKVTLTADFDGDGSVDYSATMDTDDSGTYLFDYLPAGSYSISIDPTTLPSGLGQVFDPDGLLNNETTLILGPGENNLDQDFGYVYPPVIPPVVPPAGELTPPSGPPVPGDVLLMYQFSRSAVDDDEIFLVPEPELVFMPPPIPVTPVYTGHAEPGTTISLTLYDAMGNKVGYQTVMADTGGNWLAGFAGTLLYDMPHHMEISQTASLYNESTPGLFNLRSYFNPAISGMVFSTIRFDLQSITAYEAATVGDSVHSGHNTLFNLGWNEFSGYEFLSPSTNPAQLKR
ncbi:MAG: hypothetical protein KKE53_14035, partial [Proteobacteria bacterium]|nr:hypothetical protein [Pseudomonadota bacterium]